MWTNIKNLSKQLLEEVRNDVIVWRTFLKTLENSTWFMFQLDEVHNISNNVIQGKLLLLIVLIV